MLQLATTVSVSDQSNLRLLHYFC